MKQTLLLILTLFILFEINGQTTFAPVGTEWNYFYCWFYGCPSDSYVWAEKDTIVDDLGCTLLRGHYRKYNGFLDNQFLICQEGDTVWHYVDTSRYILYNFAADVGDSWQVNIYDEHFDDLYAQGIVQVDSIGYLPVGNDTLRLQFTSIINIETGEEWYGFIGPIAEKMGGLYFLIPQPLDPPILRLNCFRSDSLQYSSPQSEYYPCDSTVSVQNLDLSSDIRMFPNPVKEVLTISIEDREFRSGWLKLIDSKGAKLLDIEIHSPKLNLPVSQYPPGVYSVIISDGFQSGSLRLIIIP